MEVEGQQGETTLTMRSEPYNGKAVHAESEIESANIRKLVGNTRGNIRSNKVRNAVIHTQRTVMIALKENPRRKSISGPCDTFNRHGAVIDQVAEAEDLGEFGFSFQNSAECRPVAVNVGYDEHFHNSLPIHVCFGRNYQPEAFPHWREANSIAC